MICPICSIENLAQVNIFSQQEADEFINNIVYGKVTVDNLDVDQYFKIARKLSESVENGFGEKLKLLQEGTELHTLLNSLIDSCYIFAAAKQYQLVREIISFADEATTKEEYYKMASDAFFRYNSTYLTTELDSAEWQGRSAKEWTEFVKWDGEK